ncbi:MAG: hypothetical protein O4965_02850 [Trichodesmium sp. St19_bin1]|nr:hypothetical protein [Trichodesmium sp. St19_bin1]
MAHPSTYSLGMADGELQKILMGLYLCLHERRSSLAMSFPSSTLNFMSFDKSLLFYSIYDTRRIFKPLLL